MLVLFSKNKKLKEQEIDYFLENADKFPNQPEIEGEIIEGLSEYQWRSEEDGYEEDYDDYDDYDDDEDEGYYVEEVPDVYSPIHKYYKFQNIDGLIYFFDMAGYRRMYMRKVFRDKDKNIILEFEMPSVTLLEALRETLEEVGERNDIVEMLQNFTDEEKEEVIRENRAQLHYFICEMGGSITNLVSSEHLEYITDIIGLEQTLEGRKIL